MPPRTKKQSVEKQEAVVAPEPAVVAPAPAVVAPEPAVVAPESTVQEAHSENDEADTKKSKGKGKQPSYEEILSLIDTEISHNDEVKSRLKESNKVMRELRKYICRSDQQQKKVNVKPKQSRKPTGFAKPRGLSDEMINFLNQNVGIGELAVSRKDDPTTSVKIEKGVKLARNELTKALCDHFKNSNMRKDPEDQRKLYLNEATRKLFRIDLGEFKKNGGTVSDNNEAVITYFDLQKYLPVHCLKDE